MSKNSKNRKIGFVLKTGKAEGAFNFYIIEKIVRFHGMSKKSFKCELEGLKQGVDYETMWT